MLRSWRCGNAIGPFVLGLSLLLGLWLGSVLLLSRERSFLQTVCDVKDAHTFSIGCDCELDDADALCWRPLWLVWLPAGSCSSMRRGEIAGAAYRSHAEALAALDRYQVGSQHTCWAMNGDCHRVDAAWQFTPYEAMTGGCLALGFLALVASSTAGVAWWFHGRTYWQDWHLIHMIPWGVPAVSLGSMVLCGVDYYGWRRMHEDWQGSEVGGYEDIRLISDSASASWVSVHAFRIGLTSASALQMVDLWALFRLSGYFWELQEGPRPTRARLPMCFFVCGTLASMGLWIVGLFSSSFDTTAHYLGLHAFLVFSVLTFGLLGCSHICLQKAQEKAPPGAARLSWTLPWKLFSFGCYGSVLVSIPFFLTLRARSNAVAMAEYVMVISLMGCFVGFSQPLLQYNFRLIPIIEGSAKTASGTE